MKSKIEPIFKYALRFGDMLIFIIPGVFFFSTERSIVQGCHITVFKQAEGAGDQLFHFTILQGTKIIHVSNSVEGLVGTKVVPGVDAQIT